MTIPEKSPSRTFAPDDPDAPRGHRTVNGHKAISLSGYSDKQEVIARRPWPTQVFLQGGTNGVVFVRNGQNYRTAFVECSSEAAGFIRGEGATWEEAEDDAHAKFLRASSCPSHEWERRGYRNGGGICAKCGRFGSNVFDLTEIGSLCVVCGVGTYWHVAENGDLYCQRHTPHRDSFLCGCTSCMPDPLQPEPVQNGQSEP